MSPMTIKAPWSRSAAATALPIPRLPPVITATFPSRLVIMQPKTSANSESRGPCTQNHFIGSMRLKVDLNGLIRRRFRRTIRALETHIVPISIGRSLLKQKKEEKDVSASQSELSTYLPYLLLPLLLSRIRLSRQITWPQGIIMGGLSSVACSLLTGHANTEWNRKSSHKGISTGNSFSWLHSVLFALMILYSFIITGRAVVPTSTLRKKWFN